MRSIILMLIVFSLQGQKVMALQIDSLGRYESIKRIISKNRPPISFNEMKSKYFGFSFIVNISKDSLFIQYSDNFSDQQIKPVPENFSKNVNDEYKLLKFEDSHPCVLIVPVLYKTYTSLDVPIGFEKAISNLFPRSELKEMDCLFVVDPIIVIGQYRYTIKEEDCFD